MGVRALVPAKHPKILFIKYHLSSASASWPGPPLSHAGSWHPMAMFWWGSQDSGSGRCQSCHMEPWRERRIFSIYFLFADFLTSSSSERNPAAQPSPRISTAQTQPSGSTQGKSHLGGGQGARVNRMRLIWEQHAGRMTSAGEGASLFPHPLLSLPVQQILEGLHGHIGPTQGQKPEKPQQELSQPDGT